MWNKLYKRIISLKPIFIFLLIILTILLLKYSLSNENAISFIKYFTYLFSTFVLIVSVMNIKRAYLYIKKKITSINFYKTIKNKLFENKYTKKYFSDKKYKNLLNLYIGITINLVFIILKFKDGIIYKSLWFISLAVYYILLVITKYFLLANLKKTHSEKDEYRIYRNIGFFLLILNLALTIMIIQMVAKNVAIIYDDHVIYLSAIYSFYLIISAIINIFKYKKYNSPILSSVKIINLFTALVSILMLQTTMIARFKEDSFDYMRMMNSITGTIIPAIILSTAIFMIFKGNRKIKPDIKEKCTG